MATIEDGWRSLDDLRPNPLNYNEHTREGVIEKMAARIRCNAFTAPFIITPDGLILGGHLRRLGLMKLRSDSYPEPEGVREGWHVPVRVFTGNAVQEKAILVGDNPALEDLSYDNEALSSLLAELQADGALEGAGYSDADLDRLIGELAEQGGGAGESGLLDGCDPDDMPEDAPTRCKAGDLWALGEHVIGCLDATDPEQVRRLLGDETPTLVFCDPPYGVEIVETSGVLAGRESANSILRTGTVGGTKPFGSKPKGQVGGLGGRSKGGYPIGGPGGEGKPIPCTQYAPIIGDETTETAVAAYNVAAEIAPKSVQVWWGGNYYADALPPSSCWIVWDKQNTGNFADAELAWTNQPTAVRIFQHMWNGLMKASERGEKRVHPTQKPVALAEWCFDKYGKPGDVILDLFLGSGMSLIAAEKMGDRTLRGCEMSPEYVDVILARWERCTGKTAELLERLDG